MKDALLEAIDLFENQARFVDTLNNLLLADGEEGNLKSSHVHYWLRTGKAMATCADSSLPATSTAGATDLNWTHPCCHDTPPGSLRCRGARAADWRRHWPADRLTGHGKW